MKKGHKYHEIIWHLATMPRCYWWYEDDADMQRALARCKEDQIEWWKPIPEKRGSPPLLHCFMGRPEIFKLLVENAAWLLNERNARRESMEEYALRTTYASANEALGIFKQHAMLQFIAIWRFCKKESCVSWLPRDLLPMIWRYVKASNDNTTTFYCIDCDDTLKRRPQKGCENAHHLGERTLCIDCMHCCGTCGRVLCAGCQRPSRDSDQWICDECYDLEQDNGI